MFLDEQQDELLSEITTATVAVENLINLRADVQAIGGVSRNDIELLDTYSTGMVALESLTNTLPDIRTFTQSPSLTNLSVATESIVAKIKAAIKWLIDKVVAFFKWIGNKLTALWRWVTRRSKDHEKEIGSVKPEELSDEPVDPVLVVADVAPIDTTPDIDGENPKWDDRNKTLEYKPVGHPEIDAIATRVATSFSVTGKLLNDIGSSSDAGNREKKVALGKEYSATLNDCLKSLLSLDPDEVKSNKSYSVVVETLTGFLACMIDELNKFTSSYEQSIKEIPEAEMESLVDNIKSTVEVSDETVAEVNAELQEAAGNISKSGGASTASYISGVLNAICPVSYEQAVSERYGLLKGVIKDLDKGLTELSKLDLLSLEGDYELPLVKAPKFKMTLQTVGARFNELTTPSEFTKFYQNELLKKRAHAVLMKNTGLLLEEMDKLSVAFNNALASAQLIADDPKLEDKHDVSSKIVKALSNNLDVLLAMTNEVQNTLHVENLGMAAVAEIIKKLKAKHRKK